MRNVLNYLKDWIHWWLKSIQMDPIKLHASTV